MKILFLFLFSVVCSVANLYANFSDIVSENEPFMVDSVQLQEIVITASPYQELIPAQRLKGEELEQLSALSVSDAIRYFSGVQVKDYGGIGGLKTVDVRSLGTNHIGVFYDGIQLSSPQNGQVDLGRFSLDNMEEISLHNGQKSALFQPAKDFGFSGSVYLKTRRPCFEKNKTYNLRGIVRTGSFGLINPSFLWEQKITNDISLSVNSEYSYANGKYTFRDRKLYEDGNVAWNTKDTRKNGDVSSFRFEGGLNGYLKKGLWNVKSYYYNSEKGIPSAVVKGIIQTDTQRQWDENFFVQGSIQNAITDAYDIMFNVKYAHDYLHYLNDNTDSGIYIDNTYKQDEFYFSWANKYVINPAWETSLSLDYQYNTLSANLANFAYPERHTFLVALASSYEWKYFKIMGNVLATFANDKTKTAKKAFGRADKYTPAVYLTYQPSKSSPFSVQAFYKKMFRLPTFNDLYYGEVVAIDLNPENSTQYNIGVEYQKKINRLFPYFRLRIDGYYNEITDKIVCYPSGGGQYRWTTMNLGKAKIKGIDAQAQVSCSPTKNLFLQAKISYTYQKAQDYSRDKNGEKFQVWGGQIAYIPWHSGSFVFNFQYKDWNMNYSFIYVGERYHNSENIKENYEQPWYTSDLSLGKDFKFRKTKLNITAEVNNLFDQQYDVILNYPMPGRNYRFAFKITI